MAVRKDMKSMNRINGMKRRRFIKTGLWVGGALASGVGVSDIAFGATTYLDEHFTPYGVGQQIISNPSGGGSTNWESWSNETNFVSGAHPCSAGTGGSCNVPSPVVGSFPIMGTPYEKTASMSPSSCSEAHMCDGVVAPTPCEYRNHSSYTDSPCKLWNCSRSAKTVPSIVPSNRYYYQAFIDVAFDNIGSLKWPNGQAGVTDPYWDHLGIFINVKKNFRNFTDPPGTFLDSSRFGCCIRLAPNLGDFQCFLQTTNPVNPYSEYDHPFPLPGGNILNNVQYTLGINISPFGFGALTVWAAVQNHSSGAINEKLYIVTESSVDWITAPSVAIGYTSNCGVQIHVDKVIAQNLP